MAAVTTIPLGVYLRTSYRPDCDYVSGELQERNVGEIEHARVAAAIVIWFYQHRQEWNLEALPEVRVQVSEDRFRVADVCVVTREHRDTQVIRHVPVAIIEILSPEDRISKYQERLADYRRMGVPNIWLIDPQGRRGYDCSTGNWIETVSFQVTGTSIGLDLSLLLAELDV